MKKTLVSVLFLGAFTAYAAFLNSSNTVTPLPQASGDTQTIASITQPTSDQTQARVQTKPDTSSTQKITAEVTPADKPKGQYVDGTYMGTSANAFYGYVQVKATISGGKLTDVAFLSYPNDRHDSVRINQRAMPALIQEAISAQSAQVDGVSGATDTSDAFVQSLANALQQAKA